MKTIAVLSLLGLVATVYLASNSGPTLLESEFRSFLDTYRVSYGTTDEYDFRLRVFTENMKKADELNKLNPHASFGVTQFADLTSEEMSQRMGFIPPKEPRTGEIKPLTNPENYRSINWEGMYPSVKNQGNWGSCWSFAVTSSFEGRFALAQGKGRVDTYFSEQQLVDCCIHSHGCSGGELHTSFDYIRGNSFCTEGQYPYYAVQGGCRGECGGNPRSNGEYIFQYGNEGSIVEGLQSGPIAVCLDANNWQYYRGGLVTNCGRNMNHCVTVVGVNVDTSTPYIRIRNSWGAGWGEGGHLNLLLGYDLCGWADYAEIPTF